MREPRLLRHAMFEFRFFEIYRSEEYLALLAEGIAISGGLTVGAGIMGFVLAICLATIRYWKLPLLGFLCACYVDFIRNTPLIVQLFFIAFGLPALIGYTWPFWAHALLALTINFSGYFAEILRSGFVTTPTGQIEAAKSLGINKLKTFLLVIYPQTIAAMYPALSGQFIFIFLTTGVVSEIGVEDMTHAGLFIDSRTFRSFEVFIVLTAMYVGMSLLFKSILHFFYKWRLDKEGV